MNIPKKLHSFKPSEIINIFSHPLLKKSKAGLEFFISPACLEHGRLLVVTSRKVGNAVTRNKIRRRLKALYYQNHLFQIPYDIIIRVRPEATKLNFDQIKVIFFDVLNKFKTS